MSRRCSGRSGPPSSTCSRRCPRTSGPSRPSARRTPSTASRSTCSATTCRCCRANATPRCRASSRVAEKMPGATLPELLDAFNDCWVAAALVPQPGDGRSTCCAWRATARRTSTRRSISARRASPSGSSGPGVSRRRTGRPSRGVRASAGCTTRRSAARWRCRPWPTRRSSTPGSRSVAAAAGVRAGANGEDYVLGTVRLGDAVRTAGILTRAHTADEIRSWCRARRTQSMSSPGRRPLTRPRLVSRGADGDDLHLQGLALRRHVLGFVAGLLAEHGLAERGRGGEHLVVVVALLDRADQVLLRVVVALDEDR